MGISHLKPPSHEAPSMRSAFGRLSLSRTTPSVPKAPAFWFTNITQSEETAKTNRIRRVARNCKASDIHRAGTTAAPLRRTGIPGIDAMPAWHNGHRRQACDGGRGIRPTAPRYPVSRTAGAVSRTAGAVSRTAGVTQASQPRHRPAAPVRSRTGTPRFR